MGLKFTILGCGNSSGTPAVGNFWGKCDPTEPKNHRFRACLAVESAETTLIIDTGTDFRHQMNAFHIESLDAVLYSHHHSDHAFGIDDLRSFFFRNNRTQVPCHMSAETFADLARRFDYLFDGGNHADFYPAIIDAHVFKDTDYGTVQTIHGIDVTPFEMDHGTCTAIGYRFGDVAYCVDMKSLDEKALNALKGVKTWIVDGAAHHNTDNAVHADLQTLYDYNDIIGAEAVYVTCLSSFMDYNALKAELPAKFYPAYDGLEIFGTSGKP